MSDVFVIWDEAVPEPVDGKAQAMQDFINQLIRDGRSGAINFSTIDPKRGQAESLSEYAAHGGRCPAVGPCDCRNTNR